MSAVSKKVTPASSAALMTALVPSWDTLAVPARPKLLQPRPTADTENGANVRGRSSMSPPYVSLGGDSAPAPSTSAYADAMKTSLGGQYDDNVIGELRAVEKAKREL